MAAIAQEARPPSRLLTATELGRGILEFASFRLLWRRMRNLPRGDGHAVLVLPGFLTGDNSTAPMRRLLAELGYETQGWGLGRNVRFSAEREKEMQDLLHRIHDQAGRPVSIVGWSLGGIFARELAKAHPDLVRQVISLGSPITPHREYSVPSRLFEAINGRRTESEIEGRYQALAEPPPVPTTSILTKGDGVVAWQGSIQHPHDEHPHTENIVVPASHVGLGVNPLVMVAVADRLAQAEGEWTPFNRSGWREYIYRDID
jgi:pimeloyl-ACP methyl ester carboxylesterase